MSLVCPDCGIPVAVPRHAREGRCPDCRPQRRHSQPRVVNHGFAELIASHNRSYPQ